MKLRSDHHPLLTVVLLEKLKEKSIFTVSDLLASDFLILHKSAKISLNVLHKLRDHYSVSFSNQTNALCEYGKVLQTNFIISTGLQRVDNATEGGCYSGKVIYLTGQHHLSNQLFAYFDLNVPQAIIKTGGHLEIGDSFSSTMLLNISDIFECFEAIDELILHIEEHDHVKLVVISCMKELLKPLTNSFLKAELNQKIIELVRAVRRICALNVVCLLSTCEEKNVVDKLLRIEFTRHVDNVIELKKEL